MFSKAYDIIRTFIFHFFLAKRGKVKAVSAFSVFTLLSGLYIKALLHPGKEKIITTKIFNYTVSAYGYGDLLYLLKEVFLSETYAFTSTSERPAILDCGANIGMSILYFKMLYPNCSIIAFEPNPFVFELLKKNVLQNKLSEVQIENTALSDRIGQIDFFITQNKGSLVGSLNKERGGRIDMKVKSSKLSDHMADRIFEFIKMDIEGAEVNVLNDLVQTGKVSNSKGYVIEYHHNTQQPNSRLSEFLQAFEASGFRYSISACNEGNGATQDVLLKLFK